MFKKIAKNTFLLSASQVIARGIGFLYVIFLARVLGVRDFGIYSFTLALIYNFIPVADFGLERLVLRDIARQPQDANYYLSRLLPLRLFMAITVYLIVIILGGVMGLPLKEIGYLAAFGLALLPYNLTYLFCSFLNAAEKMSYMAGANIALIILTAGLGGIFAYLRLGLMLVLLAYPLANLLILAFFLFKGKRWGISLGWQIDWQFWKKSLASSWVFAALMILAVFYLRLSTIMVNLLQGPEATGLYSTASRFVEALILVPQSLALALFPLSSRLMTEDKQKLKTVYQKSFLILLVASFPFALGMILGAPLFAGFYGLEYFQAIPVFAILGVAMVFFFVNALAGTIIQNSSSIKRFLPLALVNFLVLMFLLLYFVPRYSIVGAAWAVVGGELFGLVINNLFIWRILAVKRSNLRC